MSFELHTGNCLDVLVTIPDNSVDAVITDPPYAEIDRRYGKWTEEEWHILMTDVVNQVRRILKPEGSAVFILQPNSEHIGRMRPWLWEFMAKWSREWNMIQDAWWWNVTSPPTAHCQRKYGLMRPSLKACIWLGNPNCFRNQDAVLWQESQGNIAYRNAERLTKKRPSGQSVNNRRISETSQMRGGVTPFNLLPIGGANSEKGIHSAATPLPLADWWTRYIVKPNGIVLDPFCGSGTMGVAAIKNGCNFIGIEQMPEYVDIARARIEHAFKNKQNTLDL